FLAIGSAAHGIVQGAAVQVLSYGGFVGGLFIGARLGPTFADMVENPAVKILVLALVLFGTAGILSGVGRLLGAQATWGILRQLRLGPLNSVGGAAVSVVATLLTTWLVGSLFAQVGLPVVTTSLQQSRIMRALDASLPPAPAVFSRIQATLLPHGFPPVFAGLEPSPAPEVPVEGGPVLQQAVRSARASTVRVTSTGCRRITQGSGFVADAGLVVTNAHVVAGVENPMVQDSRGFHRATVVFFDPRMDLAILRTTGLAGRPLPMLRAPAQRGLQGAVLGFPLGGGFDAEPGAVRTFMTDVIGRDIYSRGLVSRDVYQLEARVHQGNSGGPFVRSDGTVVGVIFASSLVQPNIAYALTSVDVAPRVDAVRGVRTPADTGPCPA
ncbi:MAG: MarP family serine protease, partial [Actinomycetota bacterium]|nr:MarP family serine protease [Actinomycetota bacterium]